MTTAAPTAVSSSVASERAAASKHAHAKANGLNHVQPGQFAALLCAQGEGDAVLDNGDAEASRTSEGGLQVPNAPDAAPLLAVGQQALMSLMDWQGLGTASALAGHFADGSASNAEQGALVENPPATALMSGLAAGVPQGLGIGGKAQPSSKEAGPSAQTSERVPLAEKLPDVAVPAAPDNVPAQVGVAALNASSVAGADSGATGVRAKPRATGAKAGPASSAGNVALTAAEQQRSSHTSASVPEKAVQAPVAVRATVDLAARMGNSEASAADTLGTNNAVLERTAGMPAPAAERPATEGAGQPEFKTEQASGTDIAAAVPEPEPFAQRLAQHMEEVGAQLSQWSAAASQRARFTVGTLADGPVEVSLSFSGGELSVAFETEVESVREVLQSEAKDALQHIMELQGIVLGSVTVGGGQGGGQRGTAGDRDTVALGQRLRDRPVGSSDTAAHIPVAPQRRQVMTATKLDFYA